MSGYVSVGEGAGGWRRRGPNSLRTMRSMFVTQSLQMATSGRWVPVIRPTLSVSVRLQNAQLRLRSVSPALSDALAIVCSSCPVRTSVDLGTLAGPSSDARRYGGRAGPEG